MHWTPRPWLNKVARRLERVAPESQMSFRATTCSVFSGADSMRIYAVCGDSGLRSITSSITQSPAVNWGDAVSANVPTSLESQARAHTGAFEGPFNLALKTAVFESGIFKCTSLRKYLCDGPRIFTNES